MEPAGTLCPVARERWLAIRAWAALTLLLALGCRSRPDAGAPRDARAPGQATAQPDAASSVSAAPSSARPGAQPAFAGTTGKTKSSGEQRGVARLVQVRAAQHQGYDRVVFEFAGDSLPGFEIEYVEPPVRKCGSGDPTAIAGNGRLEIRLYPAVAHDDSGAPTIQERERQPGLPVLKELELTCDFEAVTTWVLGVAAPGPYRVLQLAAPPRLVVDVSQQE